MEGLQVAYLLTKRGQVVKLETGNRAENAVISSTTFPFTTSQTRTWVRAEFSKFKNGLVAPFAFLYYEQRYL